MNYSILLGLFLLVFLGACKPKEISKSGIEIVKDKDLNSTDFTYLKEKSLRLSVNSEEICHSSLFWFNNSDYQTNVWHSFIDYLQSYPELDSFTIYRRKWPVVKGRIIVDLETPLPDFISERQLKPLKDAMDIWSSYLPIDWNFHENDSSLRPIVKITPSTNENLAYKFCSSSGVHTLVYRPNRFTNILHELGHTLGLFHFHQRPDRHKYFTIDDTLDELNHDIIPYMDISVPYDLSSVMIYLKKDLERENIILNHHTTGDNMNRERHNYYDTLHRKPINISSGDVELVKRLYFENTYVEDPLLWRSICGYHDQNEI